MHLDAYRIIEKQPVLTFIRACYCYAYAPEKGNSCGSKNLQAPARQPQLVRPPFA